MKIVKFEFSSYSNMYRYEFTANIKLPTPLLIRLVLLRSMWYTNLQET